MKPNKPTPRNGRPLPPPCGWCGSQLTKGYCVPCSVKGLYYVSQLLERNREQERKRLWLFKLRFALCGASRYLPGFDTTPIEQAIKLASQNLSEHTQEPSHQSGTDHNHLAGRSEIALKGTGQEIPAEDGDAS